MSESKRSASKGVVRNRLGKNQYVERAGEGTRTEVITFRGPSGLKEQLKKVAESENVSVSEWVLQLIMERLNAT